jgi:glycerate 2-kinase
MKINRILIAPDSFKESLSAHRVADCLKTGIEKVLPEVEFDLAPLSDGGEGFMDAMIAGTVGYKKTCRVHDALMCPVSAEVGFSPGGRIAFIEMAAASGIEHLAPEERNPLITSTFGTGELILFAMKQGCSKIIMGIGGSATNDGGAGMAQAMGAKLIDENGNDLHPGGGNLKNLFRIDLSVFPKNLPEIVVACDVTNPLTGSNGASAVYAPQKGATPEMVQLLDQNLSYFAKIIRTQLDIEIENIPGAGAAGGLGGGLMAFMNARLMNGFQLIADTLHLEKRIAKADLIITGEGKIDAQTLNGKAPFGIAQLSKKHGKPVFGIAGTLGTGYEQLYQNGFELLFSIVNKPMNLEFAIQNAEQLVTAAGFQIGKIIKINL